MSEDERQHLIDFILQSQARSETRLERSETRLDRLERIARLMTRAGLRARRQMREQDARITTLVDSQVHTEEITKRNSEAIERNSESISQLAEIVRQLATKQNGNGTDKV